MTAKRNINNRTPYVECQNADIPEFENRKCTTAELEAISAYMKSNGRRFRLNTEAKQLLSMVIYNLITFGPVRFKVGQNNTIAKRLKDRLLKVGLISWDRGYNCPGSSSKYSVMSPTATLIGVLNRCCQLKLKHGGHIGYWEDTETLDQLLTFNAFMSEHVIELAPGSINPSYRFNYLRDPKSDLVVRNRLIHECHNKSKTLRGNIRIDGLETCAFDIKATHPQLIFHRFLGQAMNYDPYDIADGNKLIREAGKIGLMIMLNAKNKRSAVSALHNALNKSGKKEIMMEVIKQLGKASNVILALEHRNPMLSKFFYDQGYVTLQHHETNIMWNTQLELMALKVPSLSIHDGLRVPVEHLDTAIHLYKINWMKETNLHVEPIYKKL